jgi:hypothetical protein
MTEIIDIDLEMLANDIGEVLTDNYYGLDDVAKGDICRALVPFLDAIAPGLLTDSQRKYYLGKDGPMTDHLQASTSERGFDAFPAIPSVYDGEIRAQESSSAEGAHLWLYVTGPFDLHTPDASMVDVSLHLRAEDAWRLAEQLAMLVAHHYQGDARPQKRVIDLVEPR